MISTAWYMIVFRTVHILVGVAWVGSVFLLVAFVQPSVAAIAPAGAPFMVELMGKRRLVDRIIGMGVITIVAGLFLYWHDWHLYASFGDWLGSAFGASLTIGMVAAIVALALGITVTRPSLLRMLELGRQVAASGGPPSPEIASEIAAVQAKAKIFARASLALLVLAVLTMAIARYL
jgi:uncharacterized membrane protein